MHRLAELTLANVTLMSAPVLVAMPVLKTAHGPGLLADDGEEQPQTPMTGYDFGFQVVASGSPTSSAAEGVAAGVQIDPAPELMARPSTITVTASTTCRGTQRPNLL